ncbi:MAG: hypothetical protein R2776_07985 [Flavobacteriaceae bacterium]|nr:hypothetical protein [Flavobacteriaceae bacterium]
MQHKVAYLFSRFGFWIGLFPFLFMLQTTKAQVKTERVFDEDFKERYQSDKFNYEGKEVARYTQRGSGKYEDYENKNTEIEEEDNQKEVVGDVPGFGFLNWIFVLALIAAVVYLISILLNEGSTGIFSSKKNTVIATPEEITLQNIEETDMEGLIQAAEKEGNLRLAIRYFHLWVLKSLSQKNLIQLEEDKTNEEYFYELKQRPFSSDFKFTSYLYDYIWYGEFPITQRQYQKAKGNFVALIKKVSS